MQNDCGSTGVVGTEQPAGHQHEAGAEERRRPPVAVATAFIVTTWSRGTTSGSAADRPDETKRVKPLTINAPNRIGRSFGADGEQSRRRRDEHQPPRLAPMNTSRRSQRSSSAPANGPSIEYGRNRTANAAGDLPRAGGAFGIEQQTAGQTRLEQAVAGTGLRPQFEEHRAASRLRTDRQRAIGA